MLLELPPIPGSSKTASQDAKRSTSKLRLPRNWLRTGIRLSGRHDVVFFVNTLLSIWSVSESKSPT